MECENCCEAFVGTYEGYIISKDERKMRVCRCCKNEYVMMGWTADKVKDPDEIQCPTCCCFIHVEQLIEEDKRYCNVCWKKEQCYSCCDYYNQKLVCVDGLKYCRFCAITIECEEEEESIKEWLERWEQGPEKLQKLKKIQKIIGNW